MRRAIEGEIEMLCCSALILCEFCRVGCVGMLLALYRGVNDETAEQEVLPNTR